MPSFAALIWHYNGFLADVNLEKIIHKFSPFPEHTEFIVLFWIRSFFLMNTGRLHGYENHTEVSVVWLPGLPFFPGRAKLLMQQ